MGQEYFINSQELESKIRDLLPSQGGAGAGFDLSASTQIIPVIDLTESAQGSNLRQDLQTAQDFATTNTSIVNATNTVIVNNTGFFSVIANVARDFSGTNNASLNLFDSATAKDIFSLASRVGGTGSQISIYKTIVYLRAGDTLRGTAGAYTQMEVFTRQIADIAGDLTNPLGFTS